MTHAGGAALSHHGYRLSERQVGARVEKYQPQQLPSALELRFPLLSLERLVLAGWHYGATSVQELRADEGTAKTPSAPRKN